MRALIGPEHERAQPPAGPAFADAVTFAFGDPDAQLYGLARLGLSPTPAEGSASGSEGDASGGAGGASGSEGDASGGAGGLSGASGSALAVLFAGRDPVAAVARGGLEVPAGGGWESLSLGGLRATVAEPLRRWTVALEGADHGFDLTFEALGPPAELGPDEAAARAGGMAGYEQVCAVSGTVRTGGRVHEVRCLGQRGHEWGEPDWDRIEAARTVSAWTDGGGAFALTAVRPRGAVGHAAEPVWAALLGPEGALPVADPRLSTTYDADGRQRRAGLELWVDGHDGHPHRGSGEVLCGSTLDLGQLRLDCAFFRWRIDGRPGVGRYDVLRRA